MYYFHRQVEMKCARINNNIYLTVKLYFHKKVSNVSQMLFHHTSENIKESLISQMSVFVCLHNNYALQYSGCNVTIHWEKRQCCGFFFPLSLCRPVLSRVHCFCSGTTDMTLMKPSLEYLAITHLCKDNMYVCSTLVSPLHVSVILTHLSLVPLRAGLSPLARQLIGLASFNTLHFLFLCHISLLPRVTVLPALLSYVTAAKTHSSTKTPKQIYLET